MKMWFNNAVYDKPPELCFLLFTKSIFSQKSGRKSQAAIYSLIRTFINCNIAYICKCAGKKNNPGLLVKITKTLLETLVLQFFLYTLEVIKRPLLQLHKEETAISAGRTLHVFKGDVELSFFRDERFHNVLDGLIYCFIVFVFPLISETNKSVLSSRTQWLTRN